MVDTTKRDLRQEITDQIIRALEQGTAPGQKRWQAGIGGPSPSTAGDERGSNGS